MTTHQNRLSTPSHATLQRARRRYARALTHVALAGRGSDERLSEQHLWHLLASRLSSRWASAYGELQTSQMRLARHYSADNRPLGPIGAALECEETILAEDTQREALARFTLVDERLRTKKFLGMLLQNLVAEHQ